MMMMMIWFHSATILKHTASH